MNGVALFPLFIILICTLLPQIEYRNNTWKQIFASPQTKANVFLAKFINVHLLMLVFLVATHLFMFLTIVAINFIKPDLNLFKHPLNESIVLVNAANAYISMLAVCAIQFWIGLRFRNFIVPIGIGFALWLIRHNNRPYNTSQTWFIIFLIVSRRISSVTRIKIKSKLKLPGLHWDMLSCFLSLAFLILEEEQYLNN